MYKKSQLSRYLVLISSLFAMSLSNLSAQAINEDMGNSIKALKAKDFEKAHELFSGVIKEYSEDAIDIYGAKFGEVYYFKGVCELVFAQKANAAKSEADTKKWTQKAINSFKTCYEDFSPEKDTKGKSKNSQYLTSLQMWAEASRIKGDYPEAVRLFKKFIADKEDKDKFHPNAGTFYTNLAISYYLLETPNLAEGNLYFGKALEDKVKLRTSDQSIVEGFLALSDAVVKTKKEKTLVDFLNKHRSSLTLSPYKMTRYKQLFLKMASTSINAKMFTAASNLYGLIPGTQEVVEDINAQIAQLPNRKGIRLGRETIEVAKLKAELEKIKKKQATGDVTEVSVLMGLAFLAQQTNNKYGLYSALEILEESYSNSKHRESNLANLISASSSLGLIDKTAEYGQVFIKKFPNSDKSTVVREMMLTSLFFAGEYEQCLKIADNLIKTAQKPSEQHDICVFALGGSHYYLGNVALAQPHLDEHTKTYPNSKLNMHSAYYQASNQSRLKEYSKASDLLKSFLKKYPNPESNIYMPNAMYNLADCHFSESQYELALESLDNVEKQFPDNNVAELAYNLKGNVLESVDKHAEAEKYYVKALKAAEAKGNKNVAAEALTYLVGLLSGEKIGNVKNERMADALPYYDKFLKDYDDSPFKPQVAVFGFDAMKSAGRAEEGLENIKDVIIKAAPTERQFYLEEAVVVYSDAFLSIEGNTPEKLKNVYLSLPIDFTNKKALALLRIATIGAFEQALTDPKVIEDQSLSRRYTADVKAQFLDLKKTFQPKDLNNNILVRIGDYLREKTSDPKQSLPYYEEILKRDNKEGEDKALLGIADVLGTSNDPADKKKAIGTLENILKTIEDDKVTRGEALARLTELYADQADWGKVEKYARQYLTEKNSKKAAEISYLFALSFDKRKKTEDALANYAQVTSRYKGFLKVSTPAVKRVLEIMWDRNYPAGKVIENKGKKQTLKKSDRQTAYEEIGSRYIKQTSKIRKENPDVSEEEKKAWDEVAALVKKYEKSGDVKTLEQIKAESNRRTR